MPVKLVLEVFLPVSARAFPLPTQAGDKSRGREERVSAEGEFRPIVLQGRYIRCLVSIVHTETSPEWAFVRRTGANKTRQG